MFWACFAVVVIVVACGLVRSHRHYQRRLGEAMRALRFESESRPLPESGAYRQAWKQFAEWQPGPGEMRH